MVITGFPEVIGVHFPEPDFWELARFYLSGMGIYQESADTILLARIDKTHAVTLVLEFPRNCEDSPAAVLALIFVGWG